MTKQEQLAKAIFIATSAHDGQFDKGGKPYILHPLHLMNQLLYDTLLATIAVLHDVVEDSDYTISDLRDMGFCPRVLCALERLTHDPADDYMDYIEGIAGNYDAIMVKRKDLEHNSDITRLKGVTEKDIVRMRKYHSAFIRLNEAKRTFDRR